jgi:HD-GYP domain-containing protein (c-di-GMP phosphodiesterase class II)
MSVSADPAGDGGIGRAVHSDHVIDNALAVGRRLGLGPEQIERLEAAARVHLIGSVDVPEIGVPDEVSQVVRSVHERWDGSGFPGGLRGTQIPIESRIILACKSYEAMVSGGPEAMALTPFSACRELVEGAGSRFDPLVVATLIGHLRRRRVLAIAA